MTSRLLAAAVGLALGCTAEPASPDRPEADGAADRGADRASDAAKDQAIADAALPVDLGPTDAALPDAAQPDFPCGPPPFAPVVTQVCPGDEACLDGNSGVLLVGASARELSDWKFEIPKVEFLEEFGGCNESQGGGPGHCGALEADFLRNCGNDRICEGDVDDAGQNLYTGPDADGSEGDYGEDGEPIYDYFRDCGIDNLCPSDPGYRAADEGEGNKKFDGLWLAGFQNNRPAMGVRDPLWARTVAVSMGDTTYTMTSIDAVGVFYDDVRRIRERAAELLAASHPELDVDYMLVSATHDHEAPDTMGQWTGEVDPEISIPLKSGVSPRYIAQLRENAALSIVEAVTTMRAATMHVGRVSTGVEGFMRDSRDPQVVNDELGVIRFADAAAPATTIATVVSWGNHPEAMSDVNNFITSDYSHGLREGIERGIPETVATLPQPGLGGVAIYLQGTVGGLMTPLGIRVNDLAGNEVRNYTYLRADIMGWRLAEYALAALSAPEAVEFDQPALGLAVSPFLVPVENRIFHVGIAVSLFNRESAYFDDERPIDECNLPYLDTEMAILRLGPVTLYSVPGELFPELAVGGFDGSRAFGKPVVRADNPNPPPLEQAPAAPYMSDMMPGDFRWPIGLGNDEIGYLVPEYDYELYPSAPYFSEAEGDHYEETNSVGPGAVPRIRLVLDALLDAIGR